MIFKENLKNNEELDDAKKKFILFLEKKFILLFSEKITLFQKKKFFFNLFPYFLKVKYPQNIKEQTPFKN